MFSPDKSTFVRTESVPADPGLPCRERQLQLLTCAQQATLQCSQGYVERQCGLLVTEVVKIAVNQCGTLGLIQLRDGTRYINLLSVPAHCAARFRGIKFVNWLPTCGGFGGWPFSRMGQKDVIGDAVQPGRKSCFRAILMQVPVEAQKGLLSEVVA